MAGAGEYYKKYTPSIAAAVIFIVLFTILFFIHVFRLIKTRTWFCVPFVVGALFEVLGYVGRALGKSMPSTFGPFLMQALLVLLAPILFAASIYMFLGRIIRAAGTSSYSIVRTTWLTKVFVGGDILCFLIQAAGGGILASAESKSSQDLGKGVILAGLCLQMVIFGIFLVVAAIWHRRMNNDGIKVEAQGFAWRKFLMMLYIVSIIITLRNLFRVLEYAMGSDAYLLAVEWPIYVFDAALMVIVLSICCFWYVGDITKQSSQEDSDRYEMMRDQRPEERA